jgi:transposase
MSRQRAAPAAKLSAHQMKKLTAKELVQDGNHFQKRVAGKMGTGRRLLLGLDMHGGQVTVAMQEDGGAVRPAGRLAPGQCLMWIERKVLEGWEVHSCYEAGVYGNWFHRQLVRLGVRNLVVAPKAMGQGAKHQKTDRLDSLELCQELDRFERGNKKALSVVPVPSQELEAQRSLERFHRQLMKDRNRLISRGKNLLCGQGLLVSKWWKAPTWKQLLANTRVAEVYKEQLESWRQKILALGAEEKPVRKRIAALAPVGGLPKGMGAYSAAVLFLEMRDWNRFQKAAQVGSYTGLCPGVHTSNGKGREGSINRCGNRVVRWILVEMVWRMRKWQAGYGPIAELQHGLAKGKRTRKRLVVKAARLLAIDLWRLMTARATAQELGLAIG